MLNVENKVIAKNSVKPRSPQMRSHLAVLYAVSQPDDVDVNEVIVRPIRQMM